ncbi:MAG TPA: hypothetical protein VK817_01515 [Trebonia sp.]|jgi:hypothetical protein|nr:hypothetical protein [Trebonia sp.]
MDGMTQEEALLQADALVSEVLRETEARCGLLAQYIHGCERNRSMTAASIDAYRELRALHDYRTGLMRRRSLIQEALACVAGESPANVPLWPSPSRTAVRTQRQVQIKVRRRA